MGVGGAVGTMGSVGTGVGGGALGGTLVGATDVLPGAKGVMVGPEGVGANEQPSATSDTVTTNRIRSLDFIHLASLHYITQNQACKKTEPSAIQLAASTLLWHRNQLSAEEDHA
jgi:hypothetical protein